jgi:hypothetical protein
MQFDSFTQTLGFWNSIKKIFELKINPNIEPWMKNWFKSYDDYLIHYNSWDKRWKTWLKDKLNRLKDSLMSEYWYYIDPILYLANLYYWDELSIIDVYSRVKLKWMNYLNENSIEKTFKLTFWWILRDSTWGKNTRKKNKTVDKISVAKEKYNEKVQEKYEILKEYVSNNIYKILSLKNWKFDNNYFLWLNKNDKILYVIEIFLWLKKDDIFEMNKLWPWSRVIANYLDNRLQIYKKNYNFELVIFPKDIQKILNENKIIS